MADKARTDFLKLVGWALIAFAIAGPMFYAAGEHGKRNAQVIIECIRSGGEPSRFGNMCSRPDATPHRAEKE